MDPHPFFLRASTVARRGFVDRDYLIGAVGVRSDGAVVASANGAVMPAEPTPRSHAEVRLAAKLDVGSIVFVARVNRDGTWRMARPCRNCEQTLRRRGVARIYYTIGGDSVRPEYGVVTL